MEKLNSLVEKLLPGKSKEFHKDVVENMYDRGWCEEHGLDYSSITYSEVGWAYYKDLQKQLISN